ncbi:MAG TPA: molybdenum cofactor guanylyltransferase [Rhodopila sp.]|uniref:molybdenum cofactor guanylyltransferase n=1 Tax=Rhodopila sp. TaxID=2480087 RepID=UPI002C7C590A|nr:molybdenum cofactor guanylyltransferase [Rhodopila sp.]HVY14843.1 molybdenum cofactor guanylyltransferase [Rhodopila sp.]
MKPRLVAVILAGGAARRMGGGDKPLLDIGGRTMLQAVIDAVGLPDIAISANGDPARFAAYNLSVLPDGDLAGQGPLAGLLAGLRWAATLQAEVLLTAPGDMPFLPPGFAEKLLPAPRSVLADNRQHHLLATWPVSCAETLQSFLNTSQSRRVADFAAIIGTKPVEFPVVSRLIFANINTRQQLELAKMLALSTNSAGDWGEFDA